MYVSICCFCALSLAEQRITNCAFRETLERSTSLNDYKECAVNTRTNDPDHNKNCLFCEPLEDSNKKMKKKTAKNWVKIYCNFSGKYKRKEENKSAYGCNVFEMDIHSFIYLHSFLFISFHFIHVPDCGQSECSLSVCPFVTLSVFHQWNFMTNHVVKSQTQIRLQNSHRRPTFCLFFCGN